MIVFRAILSCLELFCPRGMVTNSRTVWFKGAYGSVHWLIVTKLGAGTALGHHLHHEL